MKKIGLFAFGLMVSAAGVPAHAATTPTPTPNPAPTQSNFSTAATVYTTRAGFSAAAGNTVTNNFEFTPSNPGAPTQGYPTGFFVDSNGITYSLATLPVQPNNGVVDLNLLDSTAGGSSATGGYIGRTFGSDVLGSNYSKIIISFAQPTNAFALDFGSFGRGYTNESDLFSFTVAGLGTQTMYSTSGDSTFFGFTSTSAFNSVTIDTANSNANRIYDNVSVGVTAVPEPATWAMMICGMGAVGFMLRARKRFSANEAVTSSKFVA